MKKQILSLVSAILLLAASSSEPAHSAARRGPSKRTLKIIQSRKLASAGFSALQRKDYDTAISSFESAAAISPLDPSLYYYKGLAALHKGDYKLAERELAKVVVMSPPTGSYGKNALKCFTNKRQEFNKVLPYSCVLPGANRICHWSRQKMPVNIYLSDGLELPKGYRGTELSQGKLKLLAPSLRNPKFVKSLKQHRHYKQEYGNAVKNGVMEWAFANTEGFLKYQIVDDPTRANILVFYTGAFKNIRLPGYTVGSEAKNEPLIVQFPVEYFYRLPVHMWPTQIRYIAGHEIGHAFGMGHSTSKRDLMFPTDKVNFGRTKGTDQTPNSVTLNDAASLRALYELPSPAVK